jgi:hypothetical protein
VVISAPLLGLLVMALWGSYGLWITVVASVPAWVWLLLAIGGGRLMGWRRAGESSGICCESNQTQWVILVAPLRKIPWSVRLGLSLQAC